MSFAWKIAVAIAAVLLMIRLLQYGRRVRTSIKRLRVAENRIKAEMSEIRQLSAERAELLGREIIGDKASVELWNGPIAADLSLILQKLDSTVQSFFHDYRRCFFPETGTEFNAEFLLLRTATIIEDAYQIALDKSTKQKLVSKTGSAVVFELNENDRILEEYPSIYHYILLAEKN